MIENDEELQKLLRQWETPAATSKLDERVWGAVRADAVVRRGRLFRKWLPVAAGILVTAVSAKLWIGRRPAAPVHREISIATTADAAGFRPVSDGAITVVKEGTQ